MSSDEEAELNSNKELIGKNSFNFYHKNPDFFLQIKESISSPILPVMKSIHVIWPQGLQQQMLR